MMWGNVLLLLLCLALATLCLSTGGAVAVGRINELGGGATYTTTAVTNTSTSAALSSSQPQVTPRGPSLTGQGGLTTASSLALPTPGSHLRHSALASALSPSTRLSSSPARSPTNRASHTARQRTRKLVVFDFDHTISTTTFSPQHHPDVLSYFFSEDKARKSGLEKDHLRRVLHEFVEARKDGLCQGGIAITQDPLRMAHWDADAKELAKDPVAFIDAHYANRRKKFFWSSGSRLENAIRKILFLEGTSGGRFLKMEPEGAEDHLRELKVGVVR